METKPTAFHSLDEWVSESQITAAATIYNPTLVNERAPAAEPEEEDFDREDSTEIKKPDISETNLAELKYTETHETLREDKFPPPPPDFSDLPMVEDFSIEVIAVDWTDSDLSNPMYEPHYGPKDVFNFDSEKSSDNAHMVETGLEENISTNPTMRECTENTHDSIVPSLPFFDESSEDIEAEIQDFDFVKCGTSEAALSAHVAEQQGEQFLQHTLLSVTDTPALIISTSDCPKINFANECFRDNEGFINGRNTLDLKCDVSECTSSSFVSELSGDVTHMSDRQFVQEYSNAVEEIENVESNSFPDEITNTKSSLSPSVLATVEDDGSYIDILNNSDDLNNVSDSIASTLPAQQIDDDFCAEVGESDEIMESKDLPDTVEPTAFPDEPSETNLAAHAPLFTCTNEIENANTDTLKKLDDKSKISDFMVSTFEAVSEHYLEPPLESEQNTMTEMNTSTICNAYSKESEDTFEPNASPEEVTNPAVSTSPSFYEKHIVWSTFFANEGVCNNTLHNPDYKCDLPGSLPVVDVSEQQGELSQQKELPFLGVNQEATQQVLSQAFPPLSTVSIEPTNHAALNEGGVGVIAQGRVGHETGEGESRQISADEREFKESKTVGPFKEVLELIQAQQSEKPGPVSFRHRTMESDSCDESDSGVSADFSPGSTLENSSTSVHKETPIEREIRRAIEREHSLRRSRGLPNPPTSPEYVEIPLRKVVPYQPLPPTTSDKCQGKDRKFAGKKMQQDIHEEAQREQDLVKLGKIPGFYDKGTVRQLKEKKLIFETFQKPIDSCSVKSSASSRSNNIHSSENDSLCHKVKGTSVDSRDDLTMKSHQVVPETNSNQIIIIENNFDFPNKRSNTNIGSITAVDSRVDRKTRKATEERDVDLKTPTENPFFKLRPSTSVMKVEQDIREAQERERELRNQRINLYGTRVERGGGRPAEREEHSGALSLPKALPVQDLPDSIQPELTASTTTSAARHSLGRLGVWPPAPAEKSHQTEVHLCPRTPRPKNPLVQRWESGLINAQED